MEYRLTAELAPPSGTGELDELQRHGATALLSEWLERVATVEGPDGVEITPYDHEITVHGTGATVRLLVDAPALSFAENGAVALLHEILERTGALAEWTVGKCEVTVTDEELAEAVAGEERSFGASREGPSGMPEEEIAAQRRRLLRRGTRLRAFDAGAFGHVSGDEGAVERGRTPSATDVALAAGALVEGAAVLTEELFVDITYLEEDAGEAPEGTEATADDCESMLVLHDLPDRYRHHYDAWFAKRFLIASANVFTRLTASRWIPPTCTAEALALRLLVENAKTALIDLAGMEEETVLDMFAAFTESAFEDLDHERLYSTSLDLPEPDGSDLDLEAGAPALRSWFRPDREEIVPFHPYLDDDPAES
ncbi:hypothetical protein SAMN02745673_02967 [Marinactinospora thermotolerans DSM 45154]|uniref:Uncharacterized protein n=1 Tax=Marinactinospora thermotolerans DSM 45154 TaxID=1122192 RepID=A0A1T4RTR2_9ACTN|nr:hypothetical protein SAMN02745673_02967 [Marinactinospora thermotolerans DSM 45154]